MQRCMDDFWRFQGIVHCVRRALDGCPFLDNKHLHLVFQSYRTQCKSEGKVDQVLKHPRSGLSWYQHVARRSPGDFRGCSEKGTSLCGLSIRGIWVVVNIVLKYPDRQAQAEKTWLGVAEGGGHPAVVQLHVYSLFVDQQRGVEAWCR